MDSAPPAAAPTAPLPAPQHLPAPRSEHQLQPAVDGPDPLRAEVRESVVLLVLSLTVTVGLAGALSAVLSLLA